VKEDAEALEKGLGVQVSGLLDVSGAAMNLKITEGRRFAC